MKHPTTRTLHTYWERLRGERAAPERAEIEPGEIRHLLADSLILELDMAERRATIRLAGTRVCALYGRELTGLPFSGLWGTDASGPSRRNLPGQDPPGRDPWHLDPWRLVEVVALDTLGVVAGLRGENTAGEALDLELLLLPLRHRGRTQVRALGTLTPERAPHWVGLRPLVRAETTTLRILSGRLADRSEGGASDPVARPSSGRPFAGAAPVRRGHLLVHAGGRV